MYTDGAGVVDGPAQDETMESPTQSGSSAPNPVTIESSSIADTQQELECEDSSSGDHGTFLRVLRGEAIAQAAKARSAPYGGNFHV